MKRPKEQLGRLIRAQGDIISLTDTAKVLGISNTQASKMLSRWVQQGWLARVRRGLYVPIPLEAKDNQQVLEEPWILVPALYAPCYIGGWTAAMHWDFTEQLFHPICVITLRPVLHKEQAIHNTTFMLTHIPNFMNFGTQTLWWHNMKISISDPHKTIIDMLYNPKLGGGIQQVIDCFKSYVNSTYYSPDQLASYAIQMKKGALFKRLGFLSERFIERDNRLTKICQENLTQGIAYLDPSIKTVNKMVTRWKLKLPKNLKL